MKYTKILVLFIALSMLLVSCNGVGNGAATSEPPISQLPQEDNEQSVILNDKNLLKAGQGEYKSEIRTGAIAEYMKNYEAVVLNSHGQTDYVIIEAGFEVASCRVNLLAPAKDDDGTYELNKYIDLAVRCSKYETQASIFVGWRYQTDDWTKDEPLWSYFVTLEDTDGVQHYYYFRVDYSLIDAASVIGRARPNAYTNIIIGGNSK